MENSARSDRTRHAVIQAALAIIARDGPGRLTLDAIARECGISKGGLTHQFRTKKAVLKALLAHQIDHFQTLGNKYLAETDPAQPQPQLAAQISVMRDVLTQTPSVAFAIVGALAEDPTLLADSRATDAGRIETIRAEAADPDMATLRWAAARGLAITSLLGMCPLSETERERLFQRLIDPHCWTAAATPCPPEPDHAS